jgi:hypothetical protein
MRTELQIYADRQSRRQIERIVALFVIGLSIVYWLIFG